LDADEATCSILIEYIEPGTMLETLHDDEQATRIAASVMKQTPTSIPASHSFPKVLDWLQVLERVENKKVPDGLKADAIKIANDLDTTKS